METLRQEFSRWADCRAANRCLVNAKSTVQILCIIGGTSMDLLTHSRRRHSRRDILKSCALAILPVAVRSGNSSLFDQQPMAANGGTDPYPIPWLDKNGSHNQPAGPNSNPLISTISKVESPGAAHLLPWEQTIREIELRLVARQPTTASCRENTGQREQHSKVRSLTYD